MGHYSKNWRTETEIGRLYHRFCVLSCISRQKPSVLSFFQIRYFRNRHFRQLIKVPLHIGHFRFAGGPFPIFLPLPFSFPFPHPAPPVTPVTPVTAQVGRSVGVLLHYYFPYKKLPKSVIYFYLCHIIFSIFTA